MPPKLTNRLRANLPAVDPAELSRLLLTASGYNSVLHVAPSPDPNALPLSLVAFDTAHSRLLLITLAGWQDRFAILLKLLNSDRIAELSRMGAAVQIHTWRRGRKPAYLVDVIALTEEDF